MKLTGSDPELDATDRAILDLLQENCKQPLAAIGEKVGLSAPSVVERIHKLEEAGVIQGYAAILDARSLGKVVTAFIGVATNHPRATGALESELGRAPDVLECHHVTGSHTLLLKVKTHSTDTLEQLIGRVREIDGVVGTETMVVLSTSREAVGVDVEIDAHPLPKRARRNARLRRAPGTA